LYTRPGTGPLTRLDIMPPINPTIERQYLQSQLLVLIEPIARMPFYRPWLQTVSHLYLEQCQWKVPFSRPWLQLFTLRSSQVHSHLVRDDLSTVYRATPNGFLQPPVSAWRYSTSIRWVRSLARINIRSIYSGGNDRGNRQAFIDQPGVHGLCSID